MSGVFVSYARADQVLARRLRNGLASLGVQVVWDEAMPGTDWQDYIATTIGELVAVLVLWTPDSMNSDSVRDEARLGLDTGKLINIKSGVDKPKYPFERLNALPLEGWVAGSPHAGWRRIVQTLDGKLADAGARASGELVTAYEAQLAHARDQRSSAAQAERKIARLRKELEQQQMRVAAAAASLAQADDQLIKLKEIQASTAVLTAATGDREIVEARYNEAHALLTQQEDDLENDLEASKNASNDFAGWLVEVGGSVDPATVDNRSDGKDDQSAQYPNVNSPLQEAGDPNVTQPSITSDEDGVDTPGVVADPDNETKPMSAPEAVSLPAVDDEAENPLDRIQQLHQMKADGLITDDEYEQAKSKLLDGVGGAGTKNRQVEPPVTPPAVDGLLDWIKRPLLHYADFAGRSRRKEFWLFQLILVPILMVFILFAGLGLFDLTAFILIVAMLGLIVPQLALQVRRFHDQNKSGWFALLNIVPYVGVFIVLIFMAVEGTKGANRYGVDPKQQD